MSPLASPVVAAWELALRLRERRRRLGIDVKRITQELDFSRNYWSAVENERKILSEESLRKIITLFEFDESEGQELLDLRAATKERGWWSAYPKLLDHDVQRMLGFEHGAQEIRGHESLLIPGLLQTRDYARAIMKSAAVVRPVEVEQRVDIRIRRQERLYGENPLQLTVIISEASLRQRIGGVDVLRAQLEHLVKMSLEHRGNIRIRAIPFAVESCGLFGAPTVHLIDFDNPRLPTLAWQETVSTFSILDDPAQVRDITVTYAEAQKQALSEDQTVGLIRQCIQDLAPSG